MKGYFIVACSFIARWSNALPNAPNVPDVPDVPDEDIHDVIDDASHDMDSVADLIDMVNNTMGEDAAEMVGDGTEELSDDVHNQINDVLEDTQEANELENAYNQTADAVEDVNGGIEDINDAAEDGVDAAEDLVDSMDDMINEISNSTQDMIEDAEEALGLDNSTNLMEEIEDQTGVDVMEEAEGLGIEGQVGDLTGFAPTPLPFEVKAEPIIVTSSFLVEGMDLEAASTPENKMVFAAAIAAEAGVPVDYVTVDVEVASRRRKLSAGILVTFFIEIPASANIQVADVTASLGASDNATFTEALQTAAADLGLTADFDQVQTTTFAPVVTYTQTPQPTTQPATTTTTTPNGTTPVADSADSAIAKTVLSGAAFFGLLLAF